MPRSPEDRTTSACRTSNGRYRASEKAASMWRFGLAGGPPGGGYRSEMPDLRSQDPAAPEGIIEEDEGVGRKGERNAFRGKLTARASGPPILFRFAQPQGLYVRDDIAEHISNPCSKKGKE